MGGVPSGRLRLARRRLAGSGRRLLLAAIGLVGLLLLVLVGPYPVSMVTSAADEISNSSPTRITMAFLGMLQAGLVLLLEKPLTALLRRPGCGSSPCW